ncbi:MAG: uracil-DNA glycosylase [Acidobacteriaceae bacterium]|nr:uracil-DNA glycosylase [Acidobacteriaceae bacterium]MEA2263375.1 uracil-DNA glycosylase [Acidobacteriaceae bacterium]
MMAPTVDGLCSHLKKMEREAEEKELFVGKQSYPPDMVAVPFSLVGQGFFPGGNGLWRDDGKLGERVTPKLVPIGGIMFVGQDFGNLQEYMKLKEKGYEYNSATWRNLRVRVAKAELPTTLFFATNAMMGLRRIAPANADMHWDTAPNMKNFPEFCEEFFAIQVEMMKPRLIVRRTPAPLSTDQQALSRVLIDHARAIVEPQPSSRLLPLWYF